MMDRLLSNADDYFYYYYFNHHRHYPVKLSPLFSASIGKQQLASMAEFFKCRKNFKKENQKKNYPEKIDLFRFIFAVENGQFEEINYYYYSFVQNNKFINSIRSIMSFID